MSKLSISIETGYTYRGDLNEGDLRDVLESGDYEHVLQDCEQTFHEARIYEIVSIH